MARIRTIKPKFWDDRKLAKISRDARLTYIGMWNFSDDLGVIMKNTIWLKSKIFPFDVIQVQLFERWVQELVQHGFISLFSYGNEEFYYLPNLTKHQVINRPNLDDVNIEKEILEKLIEKSLINHGSITDQSVPYKEGKGKDSKGGEGSVKTHPHLFRESRFFNKDELEKALVNTQYESANVDYYHENMLNWSDGKNEKKTNWLATAKNWMLRDLKEGKFISKNFKPPENGKTGKHGAAVVSTERAFQAFDRMPD